MSSLPKHNVTVVTTADEETTLKVTEGVIYAALLSAGSEPGLLTIISETDAAQHNLCTPADGSSVYHSFENIGGIKLSDIFVTVTGTGAQATIFWD